jgi:two-component system, response regulator RegA
LLHACGENGVDAGDDAINHRLGSGELGMGKELYRTILIVDDDPFYVSSLRRTLQMTRRVVTATTRSEAVEVAQAEAPDLAVVDLRLGQESGIDVVRDLRTLFPSLTAVMVSGYMSVAFAVAAIKAGASAILFKPVTAAEILRQVEEASDLSHQAPSNDDTPSLARAEWEHINRVLADCDGNVSEAARRLGIFRQSLQRKLRKYAPRS